MSRADRFDRADFQVRYAQPSPAHDAPSAGPVPVARPPAPVGIASQQAGAVPAQSVQWPVVRAALKRVGESVLADRNGQGRPHKGIDLFADAGTEVRAASGGVVLRVVDGRSSSRESQRRAGLFVDVRAGNALIYRYLHLGESRVKPGASVEPGTVLGTVARAHTSGLAHEPHLHFEIRQGDFDPHRRDYGLPINPLRLLPPLRA